jgi:anti-sigma regulatory factor (Ser/Thr protein kinase)
VKRTRTFPLDPQSVPAARRFATDALRDTPLEVRQTVELMVSELVTNCVRHVQTSFDLTIDRLPDEIRVEVTDRGGGIPTMRSPSPDEPNGRGLRIVDMLAQRWGVEQRTGSGKTVWFTVAGTPILDEGTEVSDHDSSPSPASRDPREQRARPGLFELAGARLAPARPGRA